MAKDPISITHPEIAAQLADQSLADKLTSGSSKKVEWVCDKGHRWFAMPNDRTRRGDRCPYCANKKILVGYNDLNTTHPELVEQLVDKSIAQRIVAGSKSHVEWRCELGHTWLATVDSRVRTGSGCPYCSGARVRTGYNDFATTHPELASQMVDQELAKKLSFGVHKKVEWMCDKGHKWIASVNSRTNNDTGCPYCAGKKVEIGYNDLFTTHTHIANQLVDKAIGLKVSHGSHKNVEWQCEYGHTWRTTVNARTNNDTGCPYCSGANVIPNETSLAARYLEIADQLVDKTLGDKIHCKSGKKVEWICDKGHKWFSAVASRTSKGLGCPICSNQMVLPGYNDLATTHPGLAAQLVDKDVATKITYGSKKSVEWVCENGHKWTSRPNTRTAYDTGCPICARGDATSKAEKELYEFVCSIVGADDVLRNRRDIVKPKELDIFVVSKNVAIEYNGVYFHSEKFDYPNSYHADKFHACEEAGIQLIQIFEDDWNNRKEVILDTLRHKLTADMDKVYARNTVFCKVGASEARAFYDKNHMQGFVSSTVHYGLRTKDGNLVACMSFKSPKSTSRMKRPDGMWELIRFAASHSVVGGASKLLKNAIKELRKFGCTSIVSFSDNTISNGGLYKTLGFRFDKELPADYRYVGSKTGWVRKPKEAFQKSKFKSNGGLLYEDGMTERELAKLNELYRIYDAGKRRWVLELD